MKFGNLGRYGWLVNTEHLHEVKSGYFEHMWFAIKLSTFGLVNAITGYTHAFIPFLFPNTPHRITMRQVELAEELIAALKGSIEAEDAAKNKGA
jgi:hypothetical protein|tara:strand:- start:860 stop:1141 length:282 start_codon:yes stop_codon:yes gene_type:complete